MCSYVYTEVIHFWQEACRNDVVSFLVHHERGRTTLRDLIAGTVNFDHMGEVLFARYLHGEVTIFSLIPMTEFKKELSVLSRDKTSSLKVQKLFNIVFQTMNKKATEACFRISYHISLAGETKMRAQRVAEP